MIKNKKLIASILGAVILAAGIATGLFLILRQQGDVRSKAVPATTLSLVPSTTIPNLDATFTADIVVDPGPTGSANAISSGEIHLTFDPTILQLETIVKGTLMPSAASVLAPVIDNTAGTGKISFIIPDPSSTIELPGTIFKATFSSLTAGTTDIAYNDTKTLLTAADETTNVLISTTPTTVTVQADTSASPTPTPAPTATPGTGSGATPTPTPVTTTTTTTPAPTPATDLPVTADVSSTLLISGAGLFLLVLGAVIFAL